MLHLGLPWDSSHKVFKYCTKAYAKTGSGSAVYASQELSKFEQNLVEIWDQSSGLLVFATARHYCRNLNLHELNRFVFKNKPYSLTLFWLTLNFSWAICVLVILVSSSQNYAPQVEAANLTSPENFSSWAFYRKY